MKICSKLKGNIKFWNFQDIRWDKIKYMEEDIRRWVKESNVIEFWNDPEGDPETIEKIKNICDGEGIPYYFVPKQLLRRPFK